MNSRIIQTKRSNVPQGNKPLFSVIVPAYNVEDYLPQCIDSVLAQSFQDFELILVDDGSTDRTGEICDSVAGDWPNNRIHVIHQPNSGLSAARNTGIAAANGKYLIFLDGDDYFKEGALRAVQKALEPGLDVLRYQAQEVFPDGREVKYPESGFTTLTGVEAFTKLARYHYTENAWLYAYRREFFIDHGFQYAEGCIAEDLGLTPLIIACAHKVKAISDICYNYRQREGSIMHDNTKISRRAGDILHQYHETLPKIAAIPHTESILHYLVVSFLTSATALKYDDFLHTYQAAKKAGMLQYIHPASIKALPRALILKHSPRLFYQIYHH